MRWFRRAVQPGAAPDGGQPPVASDTDADAGDADAKDTDAEEEIAFVCSTCGRTDLPPAGDWDPPICSECDAAINFDAILESEVFDEH